MPERPGPQGGFIKGTATGEALLSVPHTTTTKENGASGNGKDNGHLAGEINLRGLTEGDPLIQERSPLNPEVTSLEMHALRVREVNAWLAQNVAHPTAIARFHDGDTDALSWEIRQEILRLKAQNDKLVSDIQTPQVQANLERMKSVIQTADQKTQAADIYTRVAARIAMFGGRVHHILDFDNTITDYEGLSTHQMFRQKFPASETAEPMLDRYAPDREIFNVLFAAGWQPALEQFPEAFEEAAKLIPIRAGADEYFRYLTERPDAHHATILSGSFELFVKTSLDRIPHAKSFPVWSVPIKGPTISSIRKGVAIQHLVSQDPDRAVFYYGDGDSDLLALEAKEQTGLFIVIKGSKFHHKVAEADAHAVATGQTRVDYIPIEDFTELRTEMAHIQDLAQNFS